MTNMMKAKDRKSKSLCEESMLVFVNILKLSSLSLARRTLVTKSVDHDDHTPIDRHRIATPPLSPASQPHRSMRRSKRSQKVEQPSESKLSYVMIPDDHDDLTSVMKDEFSTVDGKFSDYIKRFHEKTEKDLQNAIVEGKAADYIKRFHEKNMSDLNNESMRRSHYVLPPPPRQVFQ